MKRSVTFIHAADLHLGAPFRGLRSLSPSWADVLVRAIPAAFNTLVETALSRKVDFVVLAGDSFDNSNPSYADYALFMRGLDRLGQASIPVYLITGNHDPYAAWRREFASLPGNVHLLGAEKPTFALFEREGEPLALIGGRGYYNQAWPAGEDVSCGISRRHAEEALGVRAPFMVGILHTGLDVDPTRSPVSPARLLERDVDYWACGHIHQPRLLPENGAPRIAFSGSPQGRDAKETGPHGAYLVTLAEGKANKAEFIDAAQVEWQRLYLDVSDCDTVSEIQERITNEEFACNAHSHCQRMVFRVKLLGRTALHRTLTPAVLEDVRTALNDRYPYFFVDAITNATALPYDRASLAEAGMFPALFFKHMESLRSDKAALSAIEAGFHERGLSVPLGLERGCADLVDAAENLAFDLLSREGPS